MNWIDHNNGLDNNSEVEALVLQADTKMKSSENMKESHAESHEAPEQLQSFVGNFSHFTSRDHLKNIPCTKMCDRGQCITYLQNE